MRIARKLTVLVAVALLWTVIAAPAATAAPPDNDVSGGAVVVGPVALPFVDNVDTTEATTDAEDAQANGSCGAPVTEASVWYQFTPDTDATYIVDVTGSDHSAGVIVATGTPGALITEACAPEPFAFFGAAGVTYWLIAFDDIAGGTNGGMLQFVLEQAPPPPEVSLTVDPNGTFDPKTGDAFISGTITCTGEADFIDLFGNASQRAGRLIVRGFFGTFLGPESCTGDPVAWSAVIEVDNGLFKGGRLTAQVDAFACRFDCGFASVEAIVKLKAGK